MPPPPHRPRFPSRPDSREEPDSTPPRGTPISDELARAMREPMPWWAALLLKKLDQEEELRQLRARLGAYEELVDSHEDALSATKVTKAQETAKDEARRGKREDRIWTVILAVIVAVLLGAWQWIHVAPPVATKNEHEMKVEVKP